MRTVPETRARLPGDETRGVRSSYGDKGIWAELWMNWANQAIDRWIRFDAEWGREMKVRLFFNTGDMIFRAEPDPFTNRTQELWKKLRIPFEILKAEDVAREYPVLALKDITVVLHEPGRVSCVRVAHVKSWPKLPAGWRRDSHGIRRARRSRWRIGCRTSRRAGRPPRSPPTHSSSRWGPGFPRPFRR